jgi:hypothetical protein
MGRYPCLKRGLLTARKWGEFSYDVIQTRYIHYIWQAGNSVHVPKPSSNSTPQTTPSSCPHHHRSPSTKRTQWTLSLA